MPTNETFQHAATSRMWWRVAFQALWLNAVWEALQCRWLYDMGTSSVIVRAAWMSAATIGDVFLVLAIWQVARWMQPSVKVPFLSLVLLGIAVGFFVEWAARSLGLWNYTSAMPVFQIGLQKIGLSPVIQMAALPLLVVVLSARDLRQKS